MNDLESLRETILSRKAGVVHFDIRASSSFESEPMRQALDSYVEQLGMHGIGASWRQIDIATAKQIISRVLHRDLAYNAELMSQVSAETLAEKVVGLFSADMQCYTNGCFEQDAITVGSGVKWGPTWHPITEAIFDTGVVFVDKCRIGLIWVEDED